MKKSFDFKRVAVAMDNRPDMAATVCASLWLIFTNSSFSNYKW